MLNPDSFRKVHLNSKRIKGIRSKDSLTLQLSVIIGVGITDSELNQHILDI